MVTEVSATFGDGVPVSEAIVLALCDLKGIDQEDLDFVLYDWINPEALAELVARANQPGQTISVTFDLAEYTVVVRSDGTLTVKSNGARSGVSGGSTGVISGN